MLHHIEELYHVKDEGALTSFAWGRSGKKQLAPYKMPFMSCELLSGPRSHHPRTVIVSGTSHQTQVRPRHLSVAAICDPRFRSGQECSGIVAHQLYQALVL
eukprot:2316546-Pyramimonas_sp.AAC.1